MLKKDIEKTFKLIMEQHHWSLCRLCYLPKAYVRDIPISPYFVPNIQRTGTSYFFGGYLGMLHQQFEHDWLSEHPIPRTPRGMANWPCLTLHIANIAALETVGYLHPNNTEEGIREFSEVLISLIESMPHDLLSLGKAVRDNTLIGLPLNTFATLREGIDGGEKFRMFCEYVK